MLTGQRKIQLSKLAYQVATPFSDKNVTDLLKLAEYEELPVYFDNYENTFDGMLVYDDYERTFHIHVNKDKGNHENSKRGRYTLAHELSHYLIDEHRIGLKKGLLQPHQSIHNVSRKELIEYEADYFASCLLMPEHLFKQTSGGKVFSLDRILTLADSFQTSVLATAIKFAEIGTHEVTLVISENNKVKWFAQSKDFPKWPFKFKVGQALPSATVAGESFSKPNSKYTSVEELSADDWFYMKDSRGNRPLYEQCYYSDSYGYVISFLWFN